MDFPKCCFQCGLPLPEEYYDCYFGALRAGQSETESFRILVARMEQRHFVKRCCTTTVIESRPCASNTLFLTPFPK